jgi:hypothetical protein
MLLDPQVSSNLETLVDAALADGLHVRPAVEDKDDPDYASAKELTEFGEYCLEYPARPVDVCLEEQLGVACGHGNQLSEVVTEAGSGRWGGWDVLCRYKPLPRESYRLVVNGFGTLVGARVLRPGEAALPAAGPVAAADLTDVLPLEKFAPLAWQARGGDPRGTSILDAAYEAWWHKRQTLAESIKFIARFGTPWVFLTAPEGAQAVPPQDAYGNATGEAVDPVKALYAEGVKMQNGGVLAAAHGTLMQLLTSTSEGQAFFRKIETCDLQITLRIHGATRMTQEARSGSKADSQTAQDVVGLRVKRAKRLLSVMLTELLYNLVKWNKGKAVADKLAPRVTLNPTEQQDWADRATALAALISSGYLDPSQYAKMDEELNLPPRAAPAAQTPGALGAPPDATAGTPAPAPGLPELPPVAFAFDESLHPRGQPKNRGEFAPKGGKPAGAPAPAGGLRIAPSKERAFSGKPVATRNRLSKQEAGRVGEAVIVAYLKARGMADARPLNLERNNFPVDLVEDHAVIEAKAGQVWVGAGAQQWRLTIGEPGKKEKAWLAAASPEDKAAWNARKQEMIAERKAKAMADLSERLGVKVKGRTMTVIIDPDRKLADVYQFDGFHNRIGWNSAEAKKGYVATVKYE